jgi:hypothetical protein
LLLIAGTLIHSFIAWSRIWPTVGVDLRRTSV